MLERRLVRTIGKNDIIVCKWIILNPNYNMFDITPPLFLIKSAFYSFTAHLPDEIITTFSGSNIRIRDQT